MENTLHQCQIFKFDAIIIEFNAGTSCDKLVLRFEGV